MNTKQMITPFLVFLILTGCGESTFQISSNKELNKGFVSPPVPDEGDKNINDEEPPGSLDPEIIPIVPIVVIGPELSICSKLDFSQITWPAVISKLDKNFLALVLNISGSFEGLSSWANLSNNFDGMGISLGILQQNLGMGSLQPILAEFFSILPKDDFSIEKDKLTSLNKMVAQWKNDMSSSITQHSFDSLFQENYHQISALDVQDFLSSMAIDYSLNKGSSIINQKSVAWALSELFLDAGKTFKSDWEKVLNSIATHKDYKSLQLAYSLTLFNKALLYFKAFGLSEVRSLLTMYDFVVQNGGFKKKVLTEYQSFVKLNPNLSETQKLLKILEIRIKDVKPVWQSDVLSRKKTIINSSGVVHGVQRSLIKEYCYDPISKVVTSL
ncbi:MAG: hypothetical protein J0M15_12140 [Deltaproteobacteria bacterium]|jgi:hypothetical protein|nr:hypothetical protein [Deltaproteobacteria bacterium]